MKKWLKIVVVLEPVLIESLTDFVVGVLDAGVEVGVDEEANVQTMSVYVEQDNLSAEDQEIVSRIEAHGQELADIFKVAKPKLSWEEIEEEDWGANWKKHFSPFAITPGLIIAPTWENYQVKGDEKVLIMDPGMAFGTGHHATTALVLQLIEELASDSESCNDVLDVGTGTGILGMAAALFGAQRVYGIDNDPVAVTVARENCHLNGLDEIMDVSKKPLAEVKGSYDLVVANIIHNVLVEMAADLTRLTRNGGKLILSGVLAGEQTQSVAEVFSRCGFVLEKQQSHEEWSALLLRKT